MLFLSFVFLWFSFFFNSPLTTFTLEKYKKGRNDSDEQAIASSTEPHVISRDVSERGGCCCHLPVTAVEQHFLSVRLSCKEGCSRNMGVTELMFSM